MGLVGTESFLSIKFLTIKNVQDGRSRVFIHLNNLYVLKDSQVNDTSLEAITTNQVFCKLYDIL